MRIIVALACLIFAWPVFAADQVAIPPLQARVTDLTGTLSAEERSNLETTLENFERSKGSQVVILMLPTTQPESIEQFGIRVAEAWKIGRKGTSDGVIVLVAKNDRRMRIEVGYGLEGAIPDAIASRIVNEFMGPKFKQGDFYGGLQAGITAISAAIDKEPLPEPPAPRGNVGDGSGPSGNWLFWAVVLIGAASVAHRVLGMVGSGLAAGVAGFLAWLVFGSLIMAIIAAVVVFFGSFLRGGGGFYGGGGFGGGGFGGGGGFSGGGGSFGGGGASGRW